MPAPTIASQREGFDGSRLLFAVDLVLTLALGDSDRVVGQTENDVLGHVLFVDQVVDVGSVDRVFVDEDRVVVAGPDVAQREDLPRGPVELVDLLGRHAVAVQNLSEGLPLVDDQLVDSGSRRR